MSEKILKLKSTTTLIFGQINSKFLWKGQTRNGNTSSHPFDISKKKLYLLGLEIEQMKNYFLRWQMSLFYHHLSRKISLKKVYLFCTESLFDNFFPGNTSCWKNPSISILKLFTDIFFVKYLLRFLRETFEQKKRKKKGIFFNGFDAHLKKIMTVTDSRYFFFNLKKVL